MRTGVSGRPHGRRCILQFTWRSRADRYPTLPHPTIAFHSMPLSAESSLSNRHACSTVTHSVILWLAKRRAMRVIVAPSTPRIGDCLQALGEWGVGPRVGYVIDSVIVVGHVISSESWSVGRVMCSRGLVDTAASNLGSRENDGRSWNPWRIADRLIWTLRIST